MIVECTLNQFDANDFTTPLPVIVLFLGVFVISSMVFCFITFTNKFNEGIVEVGRRYTNKNRLSDDSRFFSPESHSEKQHKVDGVVAKLAHSAASQDSHF